MVAAALTVVTIQVDDRRSTAEQRAARESDWRTLLKPGEEFPRAVLRDLDLTGLYAPEVALTGSDLRETQLTDANLVGARLDGIEATGVDLSNAQLHEAVLAGAVLDEADLVEASLADADLREASLRRADLRRARLWRTDLRGADLREARLDGVDLRYVCFDDATKWPAAPPERAFCRAGSEEPEPLPGADYRVEMLLVDDLPPEGVAVEYAGSVDLADHDVSAFFSFENLGIAPLQDVAVVIDVPEGLRVRTPIQLVNSNHPHGIEGDESAIQAGGRQVNIEIGSYLGGSNAWLEFGFTVMDSACGDLELRGFATPARLGSVVSSATVRVPCDAEATGVIGQ